MIGNCLTDKILYACKGYNRCISGVLGDGKPEECVCHIEFLQTDNNTKKVFSFDKKTAKESQMGRGRATNFMLLVK